MTGRKRIGQLLLLLYVLWPVLLTETAYAQAPSVPEMVITQFEVECASKKNTLCFYSSAGALKNGMQAGALGIALVNKENGNIKYFSVYKVVVPDGRKNSLTHFKCDDINQTGSRVDYTGSMVDDFFNQASCAQTADLILAVKAAFNDFLNKDAPKSAPQLAEYLLKTRGITPVGEYSVRAPQNPKAFVDNNAQPPDKDMNAFSASVKNFIINNLNLNTESPPHNVSPPQTTAPPANSLQDELHQANERKDFFASMLQLALIAIMFIIVGSGIVIFLLMRRERNAERKLIDNILTKVRTSSTTAEQSLDNILKHFEQFYAKPNVERISQDFRDFYDNIKKFRAAYILPDPMKPSAPPPSTDFSQQFADIICDSSITDPVRQASYIEKQVAILRALQAAPGRGHTGLPLDKVVHQIKVAGDFFAYLRNQLGLNPSDEDNFLHVQNFFEALTSVHREYLPGKMAPDATVRLDDISTGLRENRKTIQKQKEDYQKITGSFDALRQKMNISEEEFPKRASLICADYLKACESAGIRQLTAAAPITEQIDGFKRERIEVEKIASEACRKNDGSLSERVKAISDALAEARQEVASKSEEIKTGLCLSNAVADYLYFQHDRLEAMIGRLSKEPSNRKEIRLRLIAACIALQEAQERASLSRPAIVTALQLKEIIPGLTNLVKRMQELDGEEFWTRGLQQGFKDQWLHWLFRAKLLMLTYFSDIKEEGVKRLREAISDAALAMEAALREFGVTVGKVELLKPRSELVGPDAPDYQSPFGDLHRISEAADKVNQLVRASYHDFIVDVKYFPYTRPGETLSRGYVLTVSPQSWSNPQDPIAISTSEAVRE